MNKLRIYLKNEYYTDGIYGILFILIGILTQVFAYYSSDIQNNISLISGISGIFSVVLCSQRKISYYIFAWIQLITYVILAYQQKLYGEIIENIFYAITMLGGMYIWIVNYKYTKYESGVIAKKLSKLYFSLIVIGMFIGIILMYSYLNNTDDTQPFMDTISTVPAIIAQILMICCYREQWIFWIIIDIASIFMWAVAKDWCMVMQFIFWTINCIYGYIKWSK